MPDRPTKAQLAAAHGRTIDDVIAPGLHVLFCGINPGLYSGATGYHFARPGNRFWAALHAGGFTPRQLDPSEQHRLLDYGLGITNLVARTTARADELTVEELRAGADELARKLDRYRPRWLAVVGITAYRTAFGKPKAVVGEQDHQVSGVPVWVLPNPSGLNAHWTPADFAIEFARLCVRSAS
ncbi:G/U mismatch-specific DNA glycosylase [Prauserella oleivorans]|uniref:G/U mismatch-specific DNA glycosylase n=1 Tax=Prauserella oleivorans TaxID=1478153 RepID=A0ABW5WG04_9PSEU